MAELYAEVPQYLVKVPSSVGHVGVLMEPLSVVEKGFHEACAIQRRLPWEAREAAVTGAGPIGMMAAFLLRSPELGERIGGIDLLIEATAAPEVVFGAIDAIGPNGVVCLTGVSASPSLDALSPCVSARWCQVISMPSGRWVCQMPFGSRHTV